MEKTSPTTRSPARPLPQLLQTFQVGVIKTRHPKLHLKTCLWGTAPCPTLPLEVESNLSFVHSLPPFLIYGANLFRTTTSWCRWSGGRIPRNIGTMVGRGGLPETRGSWVCRRREWSAGTLSPSPKVWRLTVSPKVWRLTVLGKRCSEMQKQKRGGGGDKIGLKQTGV